MPSVLEERPPFVQFTTLPVEDREASIAAGMKVLVDVHHVYITPQGSKDRLVFQTEPWLRDKSKLVDEGRYPAEWLDGHRRAYEAWKKGVELPVNGTPLEHWQHIMPAQVANCRQMGMRTVEDLSLANEQAVRSLGIGARELIQRANQFVKLKQGADVSPDKVAEVLANNTRLMEANAELTAKVNEMMAQMGQMTGQVLPSIDDDELAAEVKK